MIHWACAAVAPRSRCSAGSATLTTVPSMNAMLEPRMAASSVHRRAAAVHGDDSASPAVSPSSQGGLPMWLTGAPYHAVERVLGTAILCRLHRPPPALSGR